MEKDRAKNFRLRGYGWQVIVIWENEWVNNRENVFKKLATFKEKDWILPKWWEIGELSKHKRMKNVQLDLNKLVLLEEIDTHKQNGWEFGTIKRNGKRKK